MHKFSGSFCAFLSLSLAAAAAPPQPFFEAAVDSPHGGTTAIAGRLALADGMLLAETLQSGDRIELNLSSTFSPVITIGVIEAGKAGSRVIHGAPDGIDGGVILSIQSNALAGWAWSSTQQFEFHSVDGANVDLVELDAVAFAPCATGESHAIRPTGPAPNPSADPTDIETGADPAEIDVLVVYTPAAEGGAGGAAGMSAFIDLAIAQTNDAYVRSLVPARLNLIHRARIDYKETGNPSTDLTRLRTVGDGFLDQAHVLRDEYGADLVALLVEEMTSACGIGYLMTFRSVEFAGNGFTVTRRSCAVGNLTFAHEVGHNMGCQHDRQNAGSGIYPYAYGYRSPGATFRTIMAYAPGTRIPNFSNPGVFFNGLPTGVPAKSPDAAFNALTISNTASTVAAFRANQIADCNNNTVPDVQELLAGSSQDCNSNTRPDECDIADGEVDCDADLIPDACELAAAPGLDCNSTGILDSCDIAAGLLLDCNNNGDPDSCEIAARRVGDCDQNGIPDPCDLAAANADCNGNQQVDACDIAPLYRASSPRLSPIGADAPVEFVFAQLRPALADVTLSFELRGDFNTGSEYVDISLNGVAIGRLLESGGIDCPADPQSVSLTLSAASFNAILGAGTSLTLRGAASPAVNPALCGANGSFLAASLEYNAQPLSADDNQNGTPDECEVGLIGDLNCDGFVTVSDIGGFVLALIDPAVYATQYPNCDLQNADTNADGFVTVSDIGGFVALLTR